jgi:hypothetical protein
MNLATGAQLRLVIQTGFSPFFYFEYSLCCVQNGSEIGVTKLPYNGNFRKNTLIASQMFVLNQIRIRNLVFILL